MSISLNDFSITVATANGSGSQSSNNVLVRALFRMGLPVGGKNLFPSNIQGLPTWFTIRVNEHGFTARKKFADIVVAMNPVTALDDLKSVRPGGYVFVNSDIKIMDEVKPADVHVISVPFKTIIDKVTDSVKLKKMLVNMAYVGVLAELLQIPEDVIDATIAHQFGDKTSVIDTNKRAIGAGRAWAIENLSSLVFPFRASIRPGQNDGKVLIDGNTASAMGLVFGGCTFIAWYPITPSSSVVEAFGELAEAYRVDADGKKNYAIVQAEDELASIAMVVGAGWAGARALTATSGPGLSLMAEAAGLSYYAEIPAVIWNVQRVGPSTGLPTRTMQGDLLSAYYLSHGDTKHIVLLPGTPGECFEFGQTAFDLAESLQTLVIVLSDLDIGMNLHAAHKFNYPTTAFKRGKVLNAQELEASSLRFARYKDVDGDGVTYRTLTGTQHPTAAYFTRGTGHDPAGFYSENPEIYKANMDRLARKFETAVSYVPKPLKDVQSGVKVGILVYGSSHESSGEARFMLQARGIHVNCMRVRALPLGPEVEDYLHAHERVYVIEQNRDAQLMSILRAEMPQYSAKCFSVLHYDGMPIDPEELCRQILAMEAPRAMTDTKAPEPTTNRIGLSKADYTGSKSTLCVGCGHDSITNHIITAFYQSSVDPYNVTKLSGIGCSSKTPAYFLSRSHGFNSIHGRMAPVATGVHLANHKQRLIGVSGDGDTASIGLGSFIHMIRRNVPMIYVVENNGVYGLTKGQFSATAEEGSRAKSGSTNAFQGIDLCTLALEMGCTFVARSFSGDARQMVPLLNLALRHRGTAFIDVLSPCVTFANHEGSSRSFEAVKSHNVQLQEMGFIQPQQEINVSYEEGATQEVMLHDGSRLWLRKLLSAEHDFARKDLAFARLSESRQKGEFLTGLFYWDKDSKPLDEQMAIVDRPLASLGEETRPSAKALHEMLSRYE